jgi:predicted nucleic acid-binding protein
MRRVLDAWPVCKWLQGDRKIAGRIASLLEDAAAGRIELFMSLINAGEVFYTIAKQREMTEAEDFLNKVLPGMPITTLTPDSALIIEAARWKAKTKIACAGGFALATAARLKARLVTGDPEMKGLRTDLVEWIGG